jgi:hypothetical protein
MIANIAFTPRTAFARAGAAEIYCDWNRSSLNWDRAADERAAKSTRSGRRAATEALQREFYRGALTRVAEHFCFHFTFDSILIRMIVNQESVKV